MNIPEFTDDDKRDASFHNFDDKREVIGKLRSIEDGTYGNQYVIDTPDGDLTIGTYEALKSKITREDIGKWIKIVCKGNLVSPKTKRTYKDFVVFIK